MSPSVDVDLERYLEQAYLITKTFATLDLHGRTAIADTLLAMTTTLLGGVDGFVCVTAPGVPEIAAGQGDALTAAAASDSGATDALVRAGISQLVTAAELRARGGPRLADAAPHGLAVAALRSGDTPLGLLAVARAPRRSREERADLAFLTVAAGIGSLALTNADAVRSARTLAGTLREESAVKSRIMRELDTQLATIREQQRAITELSLPILQVWRGVLAAPIIGVVDAERGASVTERLLEAVASSEATAVIVDVTGVAGVDAAVADEFVKVARSLRLLGVVVVMTGIQPGVAATLGASGLEQLSGVRTFSTLEKGLRHCMAALS